MANAESPNLNTPLPLTESSRRAALAEIDRQLEVADDNENAIERFFRREKLLELRDVIQAGIDRDERAEHYL